MAGCMARRSIGANDPQDCDYPNCGCDLSGGHPESLIILERSKRMTSDAAHDKAYREGWMQAFREWSDCLRVTFPAIVSQTDIDRMESRKQEMESYGKR